MGPKLYRKGPAAALIGRASCAEASRRAASLQEVFHYRVPGLGEVAAVVAPAPERQHAPVPQAVGELLQRAGGMPVRAGREPQVRDRIALEAVGSTLQDEELGLEALEGRQHARPHLLEYPIVGPWGQGDVELHARRGATTGLAARPGTGIEVAPILVQVGE